MNRRRRALVEALAMTGAAAITSAYGRDLVSGATAASAEPPPETKRIRLVQTFAVCEAPQYVAEELLRGEGFTDVQYVEQDGPAAIAGAVSSGEADISMNFFAGSRIQPRSPSISLRKARSTRSWAFHPSPRTFARERSGMSWSTAISTGHGRSTSAACWRETATSFAPTPSRPSGHSAPSSRRRTSAPRTLTARRV
jgi:hypothetical protein